MRLRSATLRNFRNIEAAGIEFSAQFTCLLGSNGQGKTNVIEALYLVAALRPLRNVVRRALIRAEQPEADIEVRVLAAKTGLDHDLRVLLTPTQRTLFKDGKRSDAGQFLGHFVTIAFTPDDLQLAKAGPDGRRRFLDRALLNVRPAYLRAALRYQKALKDRNRLLVDNAPDATLDAFDLVVATEGARIALARHAYAEVLTPSVRARFADIAQPAPHLEIQYRSRLLGTDVPRDVSGLASMFRDALREARVRDRRRKTTSVGPHLDDLSITLDGAPAKDRASQGQHRALVLALKLAEISHLAEALGEAPVLLLDDMSSELDEDRSRQLFDAIRRLEGQVILTSTEPSSVVLQRLGTGADARFYRVRQGSLRDETLRPTSSIPESS